MLHISWLIEAICSPSALSRRSTKRRILMGQAHSTWHAVLLALFLCYSAATVNGLAFVVAPKSSAMIVGGCGTTKQQAFWQSSQHRQKHQQHHATSWSSSSSSSLTTTAATLVMRDMSASYWFQAGDTVRVIENVYIGSSKQQNNRGGGVNLLGRVGTVLQTWEKCDVDPTCCCAEQVNPEMAVLVQFLSPNQENNDENGENVDSSSSFTYYFSEEELVHQVTHEKEGVVQGNDTLTTAVAPSATNAAPFDGMSCIAFKLEELQKMGQKPRGIASFDPQATKPSK
jgi:hypothetical protein